MEQLNKKPDLETVKGIMDKTYSLSWVDYRDSFDEHPQVIEECLKNGSAEHLYQTVDEWFWQCEAERTSEIMDKLKEELLQMDYEKDDVEEFFNEYSNDIREEIYERNDSDPIDDLLRHSSPVPVRIEMDSSHGYINSHWFDSQHGYEYEKSALGELINLLRLDPLTVKKMLKAYGEETDGRWPSMRFRIGNERVSYNSLYTELLNVCCEGSQLVFLGVIDLRDLYKEDFKLSHVTIPKGNCCGIYSGGSGGGSLLEMELLEEVTLQIDRTKYPKYDLVIDNAPRQYGYSIKEVYGLCDSAFGSCLAINPSQPNTQTA